MKHKGWNIFLRNWLWHLLILILAINFFDSLDFMFRSGIGDYQKNADGSKVTLYQRLIAHNFHQFTIIYFVGFTFIADLCWHFLFDRFKWPVFLFAMSAVSCILVLIINSLMPDGRMINSLRTGLIFAAYFIAYAFLRYFFRHRLYRLQTRLHHSENELQVLKQQLNPHFLFNSLNYLYGTAMLEKAKSTADGIHVLSELMRYSVTGVQETQVSLAAELAFIQKYIYMHQLRLGEKSNKVLSIDIDTPLTPLHIAPMLLITIIENAFKYGLQGDTSQYVHIRIAIKSGLLILEAENAVSAEHEILKGTNSGMATTRKRLALLYPGNHTLHAERIGNRYSVLLEIRLT